MGGHSRSHSRPFLDYRAVRGVAMEDHDKTKDELIAELQSLRRRVAELESFPCERAMPDPAQLDWRQLFQWVFEQGSLGMSIVDQDFQWIVVNERFCQIVGYDREEFMKLTFADFTHPDDLDEDLAYMKKLERGEITQFKMVKRYIRKGGEIIWINLMGSAIRDETGRTTAYLGMTEDITERTLAEQAVRRSEERFRMVFESSMLGMSFCEPDGKVLDANDAYLDMIGRAREDLTDNRINWREITPPEHLPADTNRFDELIARGRCTPYEKEYLRPDGTRVPVVIGGALLPGSSSTAIAFALDITERKKTEQALRESEEKFRLFMDNSPAIAWMKDDQGRHVYLSKTYEKRFGVLLDHWRGKTDFEVWPREIAETFWKNDQAVLTSGHAKEIIEETIDSEGNRCFWHNLKFPFRDSSGAKYVGGIGIDITERKITERALVSSQARLRYLLHSGPAVVYTSETSGDYQATFMSENVLAQTGYEAHEFTDDPQFWISRVHPEDIERLMAEMSTLFEKGKHAVEYRFRTKDGTHRWMRDEMILVRDEKGVPLEIVGCWFDITGRKTAEEALRASEDRFRAVIETAGVGVYTKERSLRYSLINPAMAGLLGLSVEEILGRTDKQLFGKEAAHHLREVDLRVLSGHTVEEEHTRLVKGRPITFLEIKAPMRDAAGNVTGICGVARDITEWVPAPPESTAGRYEYQSAAGRSALNAARLAAQTNSIVLLTGESGSGKDYFARYIHQQSLRAAGPFYAINCAALPADLAESELFGYEAGAFTGAFRRKRGLIDLAEGGTLLLNEIGEMPLAVQSKLLTFLDTKSFARLGGGKPVTVDTRLIVATNRNLDAEVKQGKFRADLFHRVNVLSIRIPPLRERGEDIPMLVNQLLSELAAELQLSRVPEIGAVTMSKICQYEWPGNIRELRNVLERMLILSSLEFPQSDQPFEERGNAEEKHFTVGFPPQSSYPDTVAKLKRWLIQEALDTCDGNKPEAARLLGMTRHALRRQMMAAGLLAPK